MKSDTEIHIITQEAITVQVDGEVCDSLAPSILLYNLKKKKKKNTEH